MQARDRGKLFRFLAGSKIVLLFLPDYSLLLFLAVLYRSRIPLRRHLFLDGGGHDGSSVRRFRKEFDPQMRFRIVTFEPNPVYAQAYADMPKHQLIEAALSDHDGAASLYLDREDGDGSTLFRNKLTRDNGGFGVLDIENPIQVRTVNLSRWLRQHTSVLDYIILKLDVEGAEYAILEKLLRDGLLRRVAHLFIEWHWSRVAVPEQTHRALLDRIARHVPVLEWDAQGF
ncbi:MAG: FkbM family methyltransferase [Chthoniobacterales bacterium]